MPLWHPYLSVRILVAIHILQCVSCWGLWPCLSPVCWAPLFVLTFTKLYWRIKICTQLKKILLSVSCILLTTPCFPPNSYQLMYTMAAMKTNELQRCTVNLKTPIIQIHRDKRNRPHICHLNFHPFILIHSPIYQQWAQVLILEGSKKLDNISETTSQ